VPVVVMGWIVTAGNREGGDGEGCLGGAGGFSFFARGVVADEVRPNWLAGRWLCEP
jgi:hypothetical protein